MTFTHWTARPDCLLPFDVGVKMGSNHGIHHTRHPGHRQHIVYAHDVCPLDNSCGHGCRGSLQAFIHLGPKDPADEGFARRADNERLAQGVEMVQLVQQLKVMPSALAKANAGVDQQALGGNPSRLGRLETPMQKAEYFVDERFIGRVQRMVRGMPCICIKISDARCSATTPKRAGSKRRALISLIR
jgi:hypothetical protein